MPIVTLSFIEDDYKLLMGLADNTHTKTGKPNKSKALMLIFNQLRDTTTQVKRYKKNEAVYRAILKAYEDIKPEDIDNLKIHIDFLKFQET